MTLILIMAVIAILAASILTAFYMGSVPPRIGFARDLLGALMIWTLVAIAGGGLIFGLIRLVRMAWGGA